MKISNKILETGKLTLQGWQCETQEELTDKESQPQEYKKYCLALQEFSNHLDR